VPLIGLLTLGLTVGLLIKDSDTGKQWKGISFPLVGEFPKPPAQHKNVWAEHHAEHGGCRVQPDAQRTKA